MTFWGFVFMALIVFVAFYAWYRYARHTDADRPHLVVKKRVSPTVNQPLLSETGTIGDIHREPQLLLPPPREEYSTEVGTIGEREDASVPDTHASQWHANNAASVVTQMNATANRYDNGPAINQADLNPNKVVAHHDMIRAKQHAVASENVVSNLSHVHALSDANYGEAAWLENSDLARLHGEPEAITQQASESTATLTAQENVSLGFFLPAHLEETGTIGERSNSSADPQQYPFDQAPRNTARRGYVHQPDVEFGEECQHPNEFGLNSLPDQLPVADNQANNRNPFTK